MRSGVIITFPKGKPAVAEHFASYQEARDESAKLRNAGKVSHQLWSSSGGRERNCIEGGPRVNMDAAKHVMSDSQRQAWAAEEEARQLAEENNRIATAAKAAKTAAAKKPAKAVKAKDPENAETETVVTASGSLIL